MDSKKRAVAIVGDPTRSAALAAALAAIGGVSVSEIIDSIVAKQPAKPRNFGAPLLTGKRLERVKKQTQHHVTVNADNMQRQQIVAARWLRLFHEALRELGVKVESMVHDEIILPETLSPKEHERIVTKARQLAMERLYAENKVPLKEVPKEDSKSNRNR